MRAVTAGLLVGLSLPALGLEPRDTADLHRPGTWSVGVFNPLVYGLEEGVEIETHPLLLVGSPNVVVRVRHGDAGAWRLTGEYGLSLPSPAFKLASPLGLSGDLFPSCKVTADDASLSKWCEKPGWVLVPRAGLLASRGVEKTVTTLKADVAAGLPLEGVHGHPLDAWAPVDLLFAPALNGWRAHVGGRVNHALSRRYSVDGELNAFVVGPSGDRNPFTLSAHAGLDVAVGEASRFTLGVMYFNSDQREVRLRRDADGFSTVRHVRSNEFWPTIDFIWSAAPDARARGRHGADNTSAAPDARLL
ncbi:MAG: hypothetical protein RL199_2098 [Pseudomonadota bacterium]|jgi:hypothetical protein